MKKREREQEIKKTEVKENTKWRYCQNFENEIADKSKLAIGKKMKISVEEQCKKYGSKQFIGFLSGFFLPILPFLDTEAPARNKWKLKIKQEK